MIPPKNVDLMVKLFDSRTTIFAKHQISHFAHFHGLLVEFLHMSTPSNKELKELKKKEKAAKRAAQKEAQGLTPEQQKIMAQQKMEKLEKAKHQASNTNLKKQLSQAVVKNDHMKIPSLFSHLETREQRYASSPTVSHIVHPAILTLSLNYANHKYVGSNARLRAMMEVYKTLIQDYHTPENTTLTRHLTGHLSHQIEYLKSSRPLSVSMGNAIRWLKQEISLVSIDMPENDAKNLLCRRIDDFIREKIDFAGCLIMDNASQHITNGSTVLTFGHSEVLLRLFQHCIVEQHKRFNLIIVDSRPLYEGKKLLSKLIDTHIESEDSSDSPRRSPPQSVADNLHINYLLINSLLASVLEEVDCVFLGAHAMLSNGHMYARVGSAMVAMMAHNRNIPVLTCCESIKFSDRVQLDSVTTNELADPEDLLVEIESKQPPPRKSLALEQFLKEILPSTPARDDSARDQSVLSDWKNLPSLNILNIMYDLTPPSYINKVVTEFGSLPPLSVPVILREYKSG